MSTKTTSAAAGKKSWASIAQSTSAGNGSAATAPAATPSALAPTSAPKEQPAVSSVATNGQPSATVDTTSSPPPNNGMTDYKKFLQGLQQRDKDAHRFAFRNMLIGMIGKEATVELSDGAVLKGVLHTATLFDSAAKKQIVLKAIQVVEAGTPARTVVPGSTIIVDYSTVVALTGKASNTQNKAATREFKTDAATKRKDISHLQGRALEGVSSAWLDPTTNTSLEGDSHGGRGGASTGGWDQFETNKRLFNVQSTYDENLYTKKLDASAMTREKIERAERIAREIEGNNSDNIHLREERGQLSEKEIDEEALYSGVFRAEYPGPGQPNWRGNNNATAANNSAKSAWERKLPINAPPAAAPVSGRGAGTAANGRNTAAAAAAAANNVYQPPARANKDKPESASNKSAKSTNVAVSTPSTGAASSTAAPPALLPAAGAAAPPGLLASPTKANNESAHHVSSEAPIPSMPALLPAHEAVAQEQLAKVSISETAVPVTAAPVVKIEAPVNVPEPVEAAPVAPVKSQLRVTAAEWKPSTFSYISPAVPVIPAPYVVPATYVPAAVPVYAPVPPPTMPVEVVPPPAPVVTPVVSAPTPAAVVTSTVPVASPAAVVTAATPSTAAHTVVTAESQVPNVPNAPIPTPAVSQASPAVSNQNARNERDHHNSAGKDNTHTGRYEHGNREHNQHGGNAYNNQRQYHNNNNANIHTPNHSVGGYQQHQQQQQHQQSYNGNHAAYNANNYHVNNSQAIPSNTNMHTPQQHMHRPAVTPSSAGSQQHIMSPQAGPMPSGANISGNPAASPNVQAMMSPKMTTPLQSQQPQHTPQQMTMLPPQQQQFTPQQQPQLPQQMYAPDAAAMNVAAASYYPGQQPGAQQAYYYYSYPVFPQQQTYDPYALQGMYTYGIPGSYVPVPQQQAGVQPTAMVQPPQQMQPVQVQPAPQPAMMNSQMYYSAAPMIQASNGMQQPGAPMTHPQAVYNMEYVQGYGMPPMQHMMQGGMQGGPGAMNGGHTRNNRMPGGGGSGYNNRGGGRGHNNGGNPGGYGGRGARYNNNNNGGYNNGYNNNNSQQGHQQPGGGQSAAASTHTTTNNSTTNNSTVASMVASPALNGMSAPNPSSATTPGTATESN